MTWRDKLMIGVGYDVDELVISRADFTHDAELIEWLQKSGINGEHILLAHADDGVIWGYVDQGKLILSNEANSRVSPELRLDTLQDLWLFDVKSQLHIWTGGKDWQARRISEVQVDNCAAFDENHLLWGTFAISQSAGFTLLEDGVQGLRHLPPTKLPGRDAGNIERDRVYLKVRHYLTPNKIGVNSISMSRLIGIGQLNHGE